MEDIKQIFMMLIIAGSEIKKDQLITMFAELADLSEISDSEDFKYGGVNATTIFVDSSLNLFKTESYDDWIEYYTQILVKIENFELIRYLDL
tara:strand:- start:805 stop:1080 length:276 start_codon:yes stop_codon:yes gene_type:complete